MEENENGKGQEKKLEQNKKKRKKAFHPYGNYGGYYGYRVLGKGKDPRLKVFRKEWFEDKDCLDIGCNSGIITIHIAMEFHCQSILGIDIDSQLISKARQNLCSVVRLESYGKALKKASRQNNTEHVYDSGYAVNATSNDKTRLTSIENPSLEGRDLTDVVSFQKENFVQIQHPKEKRYDTVLCLSVTKWIHLNWGDDGLLTLFAKIWKLLRPGGILVLEPQSWTSYEAKRRASEATAINFHNILIRPERFQEILLDKIGFRKVEDFSSGLSGSKAGFNRPILVFQK